MNLVRSAGRAGYASDFGEKPNRAKSCQSARTTILAYISLPTSSSHLVVLLSSRASVLDPYGFQEVNLIMVCRSIIMLPSMQSMSVQSFSRLNMAMSENMVVSAFEPEYAHR